MGAYSESLLLSHFWEPFSVGAIQPMQMGASRNYLSPTELLQPEDPMHFSPKDVTFLCNCGHAVTSCCTGIPTSVKKISRGLCFLLCSSMSINRTIHYWVNEMRLRPQSLKDPVQKTATVCTYNYSDFNDFLT